MITFLALAVVIEENSSCGNMLGAALIVMMWAGSFNMLSASQPPHFHAGVQCPTSQRVSHTTLSGMAQADIERDRRRRWKMMRWRGMRSGRKVGGKARI